MKKQILKLAVITCFAASCNSNSKEEKRNYAPRVKPFITTTMDQVPLDSAAKYIGIYGNFWEDIITWEGLPVGTAYMPTIRSFNISDTDLVQLLGLDTSILSQCTFKAVRAYIGIKGAVADSNFHLFLTPIDQNGNDTILVDNNNNRYVFDLTTPCPNTCDFTSPLYKAIPLRLPSQAR